MFAARVGDFHWCPKVTPPKTKDGVAKLHIGGPIVLPGAAMVFMTNQYAARLTDQSSCTAVGDFDPLKQGASGVLIEGLPAARMLDHTSHDGTILMGDGTVWIGGPSVTIVVLGNAEYLAKVREALAKLLPTRSGAAWLEQMGQNGHTVTIQPPGYQNPALNGKTMAGNGCESVNGDDHHPPGADSVISWDPDNPVVDKGLAASSNEEDRKRGAPGSDIALAHEMCHAAHNGNGTVPDEQPEYNDGQSKGSYRNEERSTVGTGPVLPNGSKDTDYSKVVPSENSFRDDLKVPRRKSYYPSDWNGGFPPW